MEETKKSKQKLIIGLIIALVLALGGAVAAVKIAGSDNNAQNDQVQTDPAATEESSGPRVSFTAEAGKTVLEQLQAQADVVVQQSEYGPFVESINGVKSGDDNKYWVYYVDGEAATVGAGEYTTEGGETVEWKFE
jgi:hypothetical protein